MEVCTRVPFNYTRGPFRPPLFINYSEHSLASHHITISVTSFENGVSRRSGWEARSKAPPSLSHSRNMCMVMALLLRYAAPLPPAPHHDHASHPFPQPSPTLPHTRSFPLPPTYLPCHHPPFPGWGTLVAAAPPPAPTDRLSGSGLHAQCRRHVRGWRVAQAGPRGVHARVSRGEDGEKGTRLVADAALSVEQRPREEGHPPWPQRMLHHPAVGRRCRVAVNDVDLHRTCRHGHCLCCPRVEVRRVDRPGG